MRLLELTVTGSDIIRVKVTIGYGSDIVDGDADPSVTKWECPAIRLGGQFCAISTIETTVTKRL